MADEQPDDGEFKESKQNFHGAFMVLSMDQARHRRIPYFQGELEPGNLPETIGLLGDQHDNDRGFGVTFDNFYMENINFIADTLKHFL